MAMGDLRLDPVGNASPDDRSGNVHDDLEEAGEDLHEVRLVDRVLCAQLDAPKRLRPP
jgi:hypothetical protein